MIPESLLSRPSGMSPCIGIITAVFPLSYLAFILRHDSSLS
jgi:hypothetical protein